MYHIVVTLAQIQHRAFRIAASVYVRNKTKLNRLQSRTWPLCITDVTSFNNVLTGWSFCHESRRLKAALIPTTARPE